MQYIYIKTGGIHIASKILSGVRVQYARQLLHDLKKISKVDESDAKTLLYESVKQLHCTPATSISAPVNPATVKHKINHCSLAHNFEQRKYDKEYIESFCENAPAAPVNNKIDTSRLSRNFEQREYDKEYLESFYEKFGEPSSPATSSPVTSTPAKDIVMEQVRDGQGDKKALQSTIYNLADTREIVQCEVTYPTGAKWGFNAFVKSFKDGEKTPDGLLTFSSGLRVSGKPTFTMSNNSSSNNESQGG